MTQPLAVVAIGAITTAAIIVIIIDTSDKTSLITPFLQPISANIISISITPANSISPSSLSFQFY